MTRGLDPADPAVRGKAVRDVLPLPAAVGCHVNTEIRTDIQHVLGPGIFSKAIVTFMGQFQLVRMFARMIELSELKIALLDTRGYIHHLLGNQDEAAEDLNEAVELYRKHVWDTWDFHVAAHSEIDIRLVRRRDLRLREEFAVMLYHRRQAVLDSDPQVAEEDLAEIRSLLPGYDDRPLH